MTPPPPPPPHVVLDNLPYVDTTLTEEDQQEALALVEQEMAHVTPRPLPSLTISSTKGATSQNTTSQDTTRQDTTSSRDDYLTSQPDDWLSMTAPTPEPSSDDLDEWRDAVRKAKIQFEQQRLANITLEVEKEEAVPVWKDYNRMLLQLQQDWQHIHKNQQEDVHRINALRQGFQLEKGREIDILQKEFYDRLEKIQQLQQAIHALQQELPNSSLDE